jgi:phosphoenolpyruvate phosphomutase
VISKASTFRQKFLSAKEPLIIVGAHDGLGAKLIEQHGFDGVWASGLEISASHSVPDANILTMTQYLERAQEMNNAGSIPVIADVDTGYGNSSNVHHMVRQYEDAGIAAVVMEDKLFPKVNSFVPGRQELASIAEFSGKLMAARDARRSDNFLIIARVEALIAGWGLEEALKRAQTYIESGADGILIHSKSKQPDEIRAFLKEWNKRAPIVLVPTTYPSMTYLEMAESGVNMIIFANQALRASITAMHDVLSVMKKDRSTVAIEDRIATVKEIFELQGMMDMKEHEKKYLKTQKTVHAIIPAAGKPNHEGKMVEMLKDRPVAMLDIEGKTLLQRIVESLNLSGMQDITVLAGYKGDMVKQEGVAVRQVSSEGGILHSIEQAHDKFQDSVLLHYGDVIVSHENIQSFIALDDPVAVMVSPLLREGRYKEKKLDLVSYAKPRPKSDRTMERHPRNTLKMIDKTMPLDHAHGEFVGLVLLNPQGVQQWQKAWEGLSSTQKKEMSLNDFLMYLLVQNVPITTFECQTGWAEVHSSDDYEQLCSLLRVTT